MQAGVDWKRYEASDASPCPRRHQRSAVEAEASLRRAGKLTFRVRLFDLSPEGCKAEFVERPELYELLWIRLDGIEALEASVCWIAGSKVGLRFLRAVHPAVFDSSLARLGSGQRR